MFFFKHEALCNFFQKVLESSTDPIFNQIINLEKYLVYLVDSAPGGLVVTSETWLTITPLTPKNLVRERPL